MPINKEMEQFLIPEGIYKPASIDKETKVYLTSWSVRQVPDFYNPDKLNHHFIGRNERSYDGRVSSKIVSFDKKIKVGVTDSGRKYELIGPPGNCSDAEYVWCRWLRLNDILEDNVIDVTNQYYK